MAQVSLAPIRDSAYNITATTHAVRTGRTHRRGTISEARANQRPSRL